MKLDNNHTTPPLQFLTHSTLVTIFLIAMDTVAVFLAMLLAIAITERDVNPMEALVRSYPLDFIMTLLFWLGSAAHEKLLTSQRKDDLLFQWYDILKAVLLTIAGAGFVLAYFLPVNRSAIFVTTLGGGILTTVATFRTTMCLIMWSVRSHGYDARKVLIIGANDRAKHLVKTVEEQIQFGYTFIGVLDDEPERAEILDEFDIPLLGAFADLERVLTDQVVDEIHVVLPLRSRYEMIQEISHLCERVGVPVRLVADLFPLRLATSRVDNLAGVPMLSLSTGPRDSRHMVFKRVVDIIASSLILLLMSPVFILVAVLIKLDSKGPIFFFQERVGKHQRRFHMIKFRSMVMDAEEQRKKLEAMNEADGPVFKIREDPRITKMGRFIRKYSIDEFPQLINVLKGEMSLVGPRPPIPSEVVQYSLDQRRRLSVRPGMTGLWQVSGRSDVSFNEWVELDLTYIDTWSPFLDFYILIKTVFVVVRGRGAA